MFNKRFFFGAVIVLTALVFTGCASATTPVATVQTDRVEDSATVAPEPAATEVMAAEEVATEEVATEVAVDEAAVVEEPTQEPMAELTDWTETATVDGDYYVLGNPAAPIRLVDYSDFM